MLMDDSVLKLCELLGRADIVSEAVRGGDTSSPTEVMVEATLFLLPGGRPAFLPFAIVFAVV